MSDALEKFRDVNRNPDQAREIEEIGRAQELRLRLAGENARRALRSIERQAEKADSAGPDNNVLQMADYRRSAPVAEAALEGAKQQAEEEAAQVDFAREQVHASGPVASSDFRYEEDNLISLDDRRRTLAPATPTPDDLEHQKITDLEEGIRQANLALVEDYQRGKKDEGIAA
jgi:hypothetical protein